VIKAPDTKDIPATPGTTAAKNVVWTGSLVWRGSSHHLGFGLSVGQRWDRPDEPKGATNPDAPEVPPPKPAPDLPPSKG
jgi:hypothetical protein